MSNFDTSPSAGLGQMADRLAARFYVRLARRRIDLEARGVDRHTVEPSLELVRIVQRAQELVGEVEL